MPGRVQDTAWGRRPTETLGKQSEDYHPSFVLAEVAAAGWEMPSSQGISQNI